MAGVTDLDRFAAVTEASAKEYLQHIRRRRVARLSDMVGWMRETNGPVSDLDGTRQSLIPLWEWMMQFIDSGCPGVPSDAVPSMTRFLGRAPGAFPRQQYAAEPVSHYLLMVVEREQPGARWALFPTADPLNSEFREPRVVTSSGLTVNAEAGPLTLGGWAAEGHIPGRRADALVGLLARLPESEVPVVGDTSILDEFFDLEVPSSDASRAVPLAQRETSGGAPLEERWGIANESLVFAPIGANFDDEASIAPLDETTVARGLNALGWRDGKLPVDPTRLLDQSVQLIWGENVAWLEPVVVGGRLRFLNFDTINITNEDWVAIQSGLDALARDAGARFGPAHTAE